METALQRLRALTALRYLQIRPLLCDMALVSSYLILEVYPEAVGDTEDSDRVGRELAREEVNAETESSQEHFPNAGKRVLCCSSPIIETPKIFLGPLLIAHLPLLSPLRHAEMAQCLSTIVESYLD